MLSGKIGADSEKKDFKGTLPLLLFMLPIFLLYVITFQKNHDWGGDFSHYIAQGKMLVDGGYEGFVERSTHCYENSEVVVGPILYPWGLPLILAAVYQVCGLNFVAMKLVISLFFFLSVYIFFVTVRKRLGKYQLFAVIALFLYSPCFFRFKESVLSDIPFLFFLLVSVYLIQRLLIDERPFINQWSNVLLIGIFIYASTMFRPVGLVLLPFMLSINMVRIFFLKMDRKNINWRGVIVATVVFCVMSYVANSLSPETSTINKTGFDRMTIMGTLGNIVHYMRVGSQMFLIFFPKIHVIIFLMTLPFAVLGIFRRAGHDYHYILFCLGVIFLAVVWPDRQGVRYVFPIIPFYLYFLFIGLDDVKNKRRIGFFP